MKKKFIILLLIGFLLGACSPQKEISQTAEEQLGISVSVLPQAYFVERIAGELALVNVMVGPGDDPHSYEPTPNQMRLLDETDLYLSIGVEFEDAWLPRFQNANPELLISDMSAGVERIPMAFGHEGEAHGELDPHIWLSPTRVHLLAQNTASALIALDSSRKPVYEENLDQFLADIEALDNYIDNLFKGIKKRQFLTFHPAWGYFADDYDLEMISIEVGGQEPSAELLAEIIRLVDTYEIEAIFLQREFSSNSVQALIEETGVEMIVLDPLAEDWLANMKIMADAFAEALQ